MSEPIRVLVVDDSAFTRKVIREVLDGEPDLSVVGVARDGLEALEKIAALRPDVVTLDLVMPNLDGPGVLRETANAAARGAPTPRFVIVSISDADTALGAEALQLGAVDLVRKPTALASTQLFDIAAELRAKVRLAAAAWHPGGPSLPAPAVAHALPATSAVDLVVIGTSTGGPQALTRVLTALPAAFPAPIAIALHIPAGYTDALAHRLATASQIHVVEASERLALVAGMAAIAPGGQNLTIERSGTTAYARIDPRSRESIYSPSVDALFASAARAFGARVLGVVLTGMGDDGLEGARAIRMAGGRVIAESEMTSVVYGMPRCVIESGVAEAAYPIEEVAPALVRLMA